VWWWSDVYDFSYVGRLVEIDVQGVFKKDRTSAINTLLLILQHFKHCPLQSSSLCWRYTIPNVTSVVGMLPVTHFLWWRAVLLPHFPESPLWYKPPTSWWCEIEILKVVLLYRQLKLVKAIPLQAWRGPEGSRSFRLPDFKTVGTWRWQGCQPYALGAFTPRKYSWYSYLSETESTPGP
jgi:hypothetical protein